MSVPMQIVPVSPPKYTGGISAAAKAEATSFFLAAASAVRNIAWVSDPAVGRLCGVSTEKRPLLSTFHTQSTAASCCRWPPTTRLSPEIIREESGENRDGLDSIFVIG